VNRRWPSGLLLVPTAVATESSLTSMIGGQDRRGRSRRPAAGATAGSAARTRRTSSKPSCKLQADTKNMDELKLVTKQMSREKRKSFQSQSVLRCSSSERKAVKKGKREQRMSLQLKRRQQIKIKQAFKRFRFLSCASLFLDLSIRQKAP